MTVRNTTHRPVLRKQLRRFGVGHGEGTDKGGALPRPSSTRHPQGKAGERVTSIVTRTGVD